MIRNRKQAFTLMEILIVAALIVILSGIAIISINGFYNQSVKKATLGELNRVGTALAFAEQDLGFYPKLNYLDKGKPYVLYDINARVSDPTSVVPNLDYYGFLPGGPTSPIQLRVAAKWTGPYIGVSESRARSGRGQGGIVQVRLADVAEVFPDDRSVVDWPADALGNPYVFYQMRVATDPAGNIVPEFVASPGASADYINAVVSYGANRIPGGNDNTPTSGAVFDGLREGALFYYLNSPLRQGPDPYYTGTANPAQFILKSTNPAVRAQFRLESTYNAPGHAVYLDSLKHPVYDPQVGSVGVLDLGTDDLVYRF